MDNKFFPEIKGNFGFGYLVDKELFVLIAFTVQRHGKTIVLLFVVYAITADLHHRRQYMGRDKAGAEFTYIVLVDFVIFLV